MQYKWELFRFVNMKTYNDLINERIEEPFKSRIKFYSKNTGTLYDFADQEDLRVGFGFILNLFDFQNTVEGFEYWYSLVESSPSELFSNMFKN